MRSISSTITSVGLIVRVLMIVFHLRVGRTRSTIRYAFLFSHVPDSSYGSPSPFLPFFFGGSFSRGRVTGGGGASTFGFTTSGLGVAGPSVVSAFGGGGSVTCSSFGS